METNSESPLTGSLKVVKTDLKQLENQMCIVNRSLSSIRSYV